MPDMSSTSGVELPPAWGRSSSSLVLCLEGQGPASIFRRCIERALSSSICPTYSASPLCEWLDAQGLPTATEASPALVLTRIASVLNGTVVRQTNPRRPAFSAMLHEYSADRRFIAIVGNPMVPPVVPLSSVLRTAVQMYADDTKQTVEEIGSSSAPRSGAVASLTSVSPLVIENRSTDLLAPLLSAYCVVLALTSGRSRVAIDVCLPCNDGYEHDTVVPLVINTLSGLTLQDVLNETSAALANGALAAPPLLRSINGFVDDNHSQHPGAFRSGPLLISALPVSHLADWETKVTLFEEHEQCVSVDCAFAPAVTAQLLIHVLRCVLFKRNTTISHVTSL